MTTPHAFSRFGRTADARARPAGVGVASLRRRTALAVACVVVAMFAAVCGVAAQVPPTVRVTADGIFGNEGWMRNGYGTLVVTVENRTGRTLRGKAVLLVPANWRNSYSFLRHEAALDLPPHASRRVRFTVFAPMVGTGATAGYEVDGRLVGTASVNVNYMSRGVVVLADPPRIRGNLLDLQVDFVDPDSGSQTMGAPLGVVSKDARSGDPVLPDDTAGWANVAVVVATLPMLARASTAQREALVRWVRAGGRLVLSPRGDADLRDPLLRELGGAVARGFRGDEAMPSVLVPAGDHPGLVCGEGLVSEDFGCTRPLGFGAVHTLAYDANAEGVAASPAVRELVRAIYADSFSRGVREPLLRFGVREDLLSEYGGGAFEDGAPFGRLRAALDPNHGYGPSLGIAAVLLFLYVILVGPVNFHFVGKRNKPVLALVSTPAAAAGCLLLLLGVGYLGKGVTMRYRRAEWLEVVEGEREATARRYTSFFLTRPAVFDVRPSPGGLLKVIPAAAGDVPPTHVHGPGGIVLRALRGGLWETITVREDRFVPLGGEVNFRRDGARLAAVYNGTTLPLQGAVVVDGAGNVYEVGDVPVGATRPVQKTVRTNLGAGPISFDSLETDQGAVRLARALGITDDDEVRMLDGLQLLVGRRFAVGAVPVLLARIPAAPDAPADGRFAREFEFRLLRVVPRITPRPIAPAPAAPGDRIYGEVERVPPGTVPPLPSGEEEPPLPEDSPVREGFEGPARVDGEAP